MIDLDKGLCADIIAECLNRRLLRKEAAYVLATADHETAGTLEPVKEAFWKSEEWRKRHLRYYPWYGRGLVQLTWERNYRLAGERLDEDFLSDPDVVMQPKHAVRILVRGMEEGWFTGRKLADYIMEDRCDYVGARQIVNGNDRARTIATLAEEYELALGREGIFEGPVYLDEHWPILRRGDKGKMVHNLQTVLMRLGYATGSIDGTFGKLTEAAVMRFQRAHNIPVDGVVGPMTWAAIREARPEPARDVTEDDLRKRGSRIISSADNAERIGKYGAPAVAVMTALDTANSAISNVSGATGVLNGIGKAILENWPTLMIGAAAMVLFFVVPILMDNIRSARVDDHVTGKHLGR